MGPGPPSFAILSSVHQCPSTTRSIMLPFPPLSLRPIPIFSFPALFHPNPSPNCASLPAIATSFPYSSFPHRRHQKPHREQPPDEEDEPLFDRPVIGDCLVFDDDAFDTATPLPNPDPKPPKRKGNPPAAATTESLVPEKWKEAASELTLTKKERRKIAHDLKFGSRMMRKKKQPPELDMEEYRAYRELKLSQLKPVVLDDPKELLPEKDAAPAEGAVGGGRVAPRNPRLGLGSGSLEDITEFFNSGAYMPGEMDDDKKTEGRRKLLTKEEKVLLNKRIPNLTEATSSKWLPLHALAASGEFYLLDILLKHSVDINAVDEDGYSALHRAIIGKKQAIVNYLLRNSANPLVRDRDGATLIHYAVQTASSQTIKILLLYNVDINLPDEDGWTPLHLAVQTQRTDIMRLLLIKGADRTLRNKDGLTPLDMCLHSGHSKRTYELIRLLREPPKSKSYS